MGFFTTSVTGLKTVVTAGLCSDNRWKCSG